MKLPYHIKQNFIVLSPDKTASIEPADATLYDRLDSKYNNFIGHELISSYEFDADWSSWEVHPYGDEIIFLFSGEVEFLLKTESGEQSITLTEQGQYLVLPKGIWHTAKTQTPSKLLFITPGQGTQHKVI